MGTCEPPVSLTTMVSSLVVAAPGTTRKGKDRDYTH
jgi:hypothetical protein